MSGMFDNLGAGWGSQPVNSDALGYLSSVQSNPLTQATSSGWMSNDFMKGMLGGKDASGMQMQGWGMPALSAVQGIGNAWMGMKQYGLAKDQFNFTKEQFAKNFGAQQKLTNSRLEDRQRARIASNPGAYQSVGTYMKENGI